MAPPEPIVTASGYELPDAVRPEIASAFHKSRRVAEHVDALTREVAIWRHGRHYEVVTDRDPQTGEKTVRIKLEGFDRLAARWSTIIGDIVQGSRNSLDNLMYGIAEACAGSSLKEAEAEKLGFPIYGDKPLPEGAVNSKLAYVPPEVVREFVREVQPYPHADAEHGYTMLWIIHRLSNLDKHRAMHLAVAQVTEAKMLGRLAVRDFWLRPPGTWLQHDEPIAGYTPVDPSEPDAEFELALDVIFKGAHPAANRPVLGIVKDMSDVVADVMIEVAARYESVAPPR